MLTENLAALLAGGFALAGVAISGALAILGFGVKARHDFRSSLQTRHFERRLSAYERTFDCAFAIFLTGSKVPSVEDMRSINRDLILTASPEVLRAWNRIGDCSSEKLRAFGKTETAILAEQTAVARGIAKAIRQDLFPGQVALADADIRFIEPKVIMPPTASISLSNRTQIIVLRRCIKRIQSPLMPAARVRIGSSCWPGRNKKHRGPSEDRGATPHETRLVRQLHPMLFPQLWQR